MPAATSALCLIRVHEETITARQGPRGGEVASAGQRKWVIALLCFALLCFGQGHGDHIACAAVCL